METKVVNVKHEAYDVYIGRRSIFGNKYKVGRDGSRDVVIEKFKRAFWIRLNNDIKFQQAVDELRGKVLGCHCVPQNCHGDIIVSYLKWRFPNDS